MRQETEQEKQIKKFEDFMEKRRREKVDSIEENIKIMFSSLKKMKSFFDNGEFEKIDSAVNAIQTANSCVETNAEQITNLGFAQEVVPLETLMRGFLKSIQKDKRGNGEINKNTKIYT